MLVLYDRFQASAVCHVACVHLGYSDHPWSRTFLNVCVNRRFARIPTARYGAHLGICDRVGPSEACRRRFSQQWSRACTDRRSSAPGKGLSYAMNDLLFTVKGQDGNAARARPDMASYDVEAGYTPQQSEKGKDMDAFFQKVEDVKRDMTEIKAKEREIQQMHERSKTIVRQKEMQQHREDMQVNAG